MDDNPFELSGSKAATDEVDTSKLDFDYVASCTNAAELLSILRELESGRHGIFPGLQQAVEDRLLAVMAPVDRARYVALKGPTRDEVDAARERGKELAAELAALEKASARAAGNGSRALPPVRTPPSIAHPLSVAPAASVVPADAPPKRVDPKSRPFSEAYGSWDKFDVDQALNDADADFAAEERKRDAQRAENEARDAAARAARAAELRKARLPSNLDTLDPAMRAQYAEREKIKGNEAFKTASFEEAVASYTRSLAYDSASAAAALVFSNRAQARLKLNLWESAEDDASAALAINADNAKAWMRRGTARLKRGRYADAAADLRHLVSGAVPSANEAAVKEAKKLLVEVDAKLAAAAAEGRGDGAGAPSSTSSAQVPPESAPGGAAVRRRVMIQEASDDEEEEGDAAAPAGVFTGTGVSRAASAAASMMPVAMKKLVVIDGGGDDDDWGSDDNDEPFIRPAAIASASAPPTSTAAASSVQPPPIPPRVTATVTTASTESSSVAFREGGNAYFKAGDFARAVEAYAQAATAAKSPTEGSAALSNRAQALLKLKRWVEAETDATLALELERVPADALSHIAAADDAPTAARALVADRDSAGTALLVKLLHRRALARRELGALPTSLADLTVAAALEPANATVKSDLLAVRALVKAAHAALQPRAAATAKATVTATSTAAAVTISSPTSATVPSRAPADAPKPPLIQAVSSSTTTSSPPAKPVVAAARPAKKTPAEGAAGGARMATSPSASVVAAAAAAAKALPAPPRSATDFELSVGGLRRSPSTLFKWLRSSVTGGQLAAFFERASLDAELLGRVAGGLAAGGREGKLTDAEDVEWVRGVIAALDGARGASTAADMLGEDERANLDAARKI